ncbi:hypothetical protein NQZ68_041643 [Dissostichus eleginoides]|nr:hypothetical protein NQZ68_041643 [Dissostichus eleginoides]
MLSIAIYSNSQHVRCACWAFKGLHQAQIFLSVITEGKLPKDSVEGIATDSAYGYSLLVVFLRASDNNRSTTVMDSFLDAVAKCGVPSRVSTDHGGENNSVCLMMNIFRGSHRGSALRGRSTHNQRIERLWGDLWRGVSNVYYDLFNFLESEGIIDIDNEMHMWALHYVYLPRINHDLRGFWTSGTIMV